MKLNKNDLKKIIEFHGHIGPWVLTGFIIGKLAKTNLKKITRISLKNPLKPPQSCLIDGVQLATGFTVGRGEVRLTQSKRIEIIITGEGEEIYISLNNDFKKKLFGYKQKYSHELAEYIGNTFIKFF